MLFLSFRGLFLARPAAKIESMPHLAQLGQHSSAAFGVNEGNLCTVRPEPRRTVNHPRPFALKGGDGSLYVFYFIGHMMHAGAAFFEELGNRAFTGGRLQKLYLRLSDAKKGYLNLLLDNFLTSMKRHVQLVTIERECLVKRLDGNAYVIDFF